MGREGQAHSASVERRVCLKVVIIKIPTVRQRPGDWGRGTAQKKEAATAERDGMLSPSGRQTKTRTQCRGDILLVSIFVNYVMKNSNKRDKETERHSEELQQATCNKQLATNNLQRALNEQKL